MPAAAKTKPGGKKQSERKGYAAHAERMAQRSREQSAARREIGPIPKVGNVKRRENCRLDLRKFCETYNPKAFFWKWSAAHLKAIARLEEAVLHGAMYAFAMPRGNGKSVLCRMAALWATSYSHNRFVFIIGATAPKAEENLEAIKTFMGLKRYAQDFPEIAYPVRRLGNLAHRAGGQTCMEEPTKIKWGKDGIKLPTVPVPKNWPEHWPKREDGMAPSSGASIVVAGLTGDGIRGTLETISTGEQVRPDCVLLDDPQTDDSAKSVAQNADRELLISDAVLGMAGPGESISAFMPCTVIKAGDLVDRILDRKLHPEWRGERTRLLTTMPTDMEAWERYFEVYRTCHLKEPPNNFAEANRYYEEHRAELDAGAEASWPDRKNKSNVSAIQHAMNLYCDRGPEAFFAGFQNDPLADRDRDKIEAVTAEYVTRKTNGIGRRVVPMQADRLTAFVDVHQALLFYAVCAWEPNFAGYLIDYGTWPDQRRSFFTLLDARQTIEMETKATSFEASIYQALAAISAELLGREWERDGDGAMMKIGRCLVDANWGVSTDTVYQFCRQSPHSSVLMPSHGKYVGASTQPFSDYRKKMGERVGLNWRIPSIKGTRAIRHVLFDTNAWKSFVYARLATPLGGGGSLSLFGDRPDQHRLFADHIVAEYRVEVAGRGRRLDEWKARPHRPDNHWLDCLVGCAVGAEIEGVKLPETQSGTQHRRPEGPKRKLSEIQAEKLARVGR